MKAKYIILEALLLRGMKIVLDSICAKEEAFIVFENHSKSLICIMNYKCNFAKL